MKTYFRNFFVAVFVSMQFSIGFTLLEASQSVSEVTSSEHFTINRQAI